MRKRSTDVVGLFPGRDEEGADGDWPERDHQERFEEEADIQAALRDGETESWQRSGRVGTE